MLYSNKALFAHVPAAHVALHQCDKMLSDQSPQPTEVILLDCFTDIPRCFNDGYEKVTLLLLLLRQTEISCKYFTM